MERDEHASHHLTFMISHTHTPHDEASEDLSTYVSSKSYASISSDKRYGTVTWPTKATQGIKSMRDMDMVGDGDVVEVGALKVVDT